MPAGFGTWVSEAGFRKQDFGSRISEPEFRKLGFESWVSKPGPTLGRRFLTGISTTTASDRTVAWAIARPTSFPETLRTRCTPVCTKLRCAFFNTSKVLPCGLELEVSYLVS